MSGCLGLLDPERVRVLFVKRAAADAVLVHFRIGKSACLISVFTSNCGAALLPARDAQPCTKDQTRACCLYSMPNDLLFEEASMPIGNDG